MYDRLKDNDSRVRKNTLMVLTHLILNDMIRVKGQISEMAVCLEDKEQRIADLAKLFFHELSQKGNSLYPVSLIVIGLFLLLRKDTISFQMPLANCLPILEWIQKCSTTS